MGEDKIYGKRIEKLREVLQKRKLSAVMLNSLELTLPNIYYFTGYYDMTSSMLLLTKDTRRLYAKYESAIEQSRIETEILSRKKRFSNILKEEKLARSRIGIDGSLNYALFAALKKRLPSVKFVDVSEEIAKIRAAKDSDEIAKIADACRITDKILGKIAPIKAHNEAEVEFLIKEQMLKNRVEPAFPPIVAGDGSSSNVHYFANNRKFASNLLLDLGVLVNHYCSDVSRTFAIGNSPEAKKAIRTLSVLQGELDDLVKPGISAGEVHKFAADYLDKAGYKNENFKNFHRLGHGVGLEVHEYPSFGPKDKTILEENMVFTLEPALYFKGRFGARIEDTVLLTKKGMKRLSRFRY